MAKIRKCLSSLGVLLAVCTFIPALPAEADSDVATWLRAGIPAEGSAGNWMLANGSDIRHLTMASDGTLFCYANPAGTSYTLFKSTDNGYSWSCAGKVTDAIVDIATARDNPRHIYYASAAAVYLSNDAGNTFAMLPANPGGAGSNNVEITCLDVALTNRNSHIITVGTRDTDSLQYGGIYTLDESMPFSWADTNLTGYDVYDAGFSPAFTVDREMVAVVTDEVDTLVTARIGDTAWGSIIGDAKIDRDNSGVPTPVVVSRSASIIFPDDYETVTLENRIQFIGIDTAAGQGDVYRINRVRPPGNSKAADLNIGSAYGVNNIDISSLAAAGDAATAILLAGTAGSTQVYLSPDGGRNWTRSVKEPTGQGTTSVVMPPKFGSQGKAYAATCGSESAFSCTTDKGSTWNQLGLIDTKISSIIDVAPSPTYGQDKTLFLLTHRTGGKHSLWRSLSGGAQWERTYSSALPNISVIDRIKVSPRYGNNSKVVFLVSNSSTPALWVSTDNGQTFNRRDTHKPVTGASFSVDAWSAVDNNALFLASYDGSNGVVYHTANGGLWYDTEAIAGNQPVSSIALSPDYQQDKTLLVGNTAGWVYWSCDDGKSFQALPPDITTPPLTGNLSIGFDAKYASNKTVYAASDSADKGIYRYIIGKSSTWERIDGTLPGGGLLGQMAISADGVLYATNFKTDGGMERCLKPAYPLGPTFETVTRGLNDNATLTGLWIQDNTLWSIDTTNTRLMTYVDSLTQPVSPTSPPQDTKSIGTIVNYTVPNIILEWDTMKGATDYQWQVNYDSNFTTIPAGFEGRTEATMARLPALDPFTNYYWRVRADQPIISLWSPTYSFTTCIDAESTAPAIVSPAGGSGSVDLKPIFQWSAIPWGHHYELLVATDASFANAVIVKTGDYTLPSTAWQSDINLNYNTTYYWKVRATGSANRSAWSAVSAFTTRLAPTPPPATAAPPVPLSPSQMMFPSPASTPRPSPTPAPPLLPIPATGPDWIIYVIGALALVVIMQSVVILVLMIATLRRL